MLSSWTTALRVVSYISVPREIVAAVTPRLPTVAVRVFSTPEYPAIEAVAE